MLSNLHFDSFAMDDNPHDGKCEDTNEICCSTIIEEKPAVKCDEGDGYKCIPLQVSEVLMYNAHNPNNAF